MLREKDTEKAGRMKKAKPQLEVKGRY